MLPSFSRFLFNDGKVVLKSNNAKTCCSLQGTGITPHDVRFYFENNHFHFTWFCFNINRTNKNGQWRNYFEDIDRFDIRKRRGGISLYIKLLLNS
jgi:hypothetical protein